MADGVIRTEIRIVDMITDAGERQIEIHYPIDTSSDVDLYGLLVAAIVKVAEDSREGRS